MNKQLHCLLLGVLSLWTSLAAQAPADDPLQRLDFDGPRMRQPLQVQEGRQWVDLCGLVPGKDYLLYVQGAGARVELERRGTPPEKEELSFRAEAACERLVLDAQVKGAWAEVWFSIAEREDSFVGGLRGVDVTLKKPKALVEDILIGGNCFNVSAINGRGSAFSMGAFSGGANSIGFDSGVVLATGNVLKCVAGPNNNDGYSSNISNINDPDLRAIASGPIRDGAIIEFDFIPTASTVSFDFVFASEEYCEWVNSAFNDVFGFFISGPGINGPFSNNAINLALLPNGTPIAVNSVNHQINSEYYVGNIPEGSAQLIDPDCEDHPTSSGAAVEDLQFDGFTTVLTATANVQPCETYHIKLAVADITDGLWDAAVFLRANSFEAGGGAEGEVYSALTGTNLVYENCADAVLTLTRVGGDLDLPLPVPITVSPASTAIPGLDYEPLPDSIVIPAGETTLQLEVEVLPDSLIEGEETILFQLNEPCTCQLNTFELRIQDTPPLDLELPALALCPGDSLTLTPTLGGGTPGTSLSYLWSTGDTASAILVGTDSLATYSVTVTDGCGSQSIATTTVTALPLPQAFIGGTYQQCAANPQPVSIPVQFTGNGPWRFSYALDGVYQATLETGENPYLLSVEGPGTVELLSVESLTDGCVGSVSGSALVQPLELTLTLTPTDVRCFGGADGSILSEVSGGAEPYSYSWSNGAATADLAGLSPGLYSLTVTDANGCTGSAAVAIAEPPPLELELQATQTITCAQPLGALSGQVSGGVPPYAYLWSHGDSLPETDSLSAGTYFLTVVDANGCS
ncbi:MAG: hypothetical protein D6765_00650, partial [Bacteroidetes bacterium]